MAVERGRWRDGRWPLADDSWRLTVDGSWRPQTPNQTQNLRTLNLILSELRHAIPGQ